MRSSWGLMKIWWEMPSLTSIPSSKKAMRSATSRAKPISWVTQRMVMPVAASSRMASRTSSIISGSSAEVGSSKSMIWGCMASGRAMATRAGDGDALLLTAGQLGGVFVGLLGNSDAFEQLHDGGFGLCAGGVADALGREHDVVDGGHVRKEIELLMHYADIGGNRLTGEIPPELGQLVSLKELVLGRNQLTGKIPPGLGRLVHLTRLSLSGNRLTGDIPAELGQLADSLRTLYVGGNQLTGCIPAELSEISDSDVARIGLPNC